MSHAFIDAVAMTPTHDGETALVVDLRFASGGRSQVQVDPDSIGDVLTKANARSINDLIGKPWSVLNVRTPQFGIPTDK